MSTKNALDSLIERIADEHLRKAIQEEVRSLRNSREFGLVFERHFPENVSLPSHPIRRGARVTLRNSDTLEPIGVVLSVAGSEASVMDEKGGICRLPVDQLVVVKMFGEAVYPGLEDLGHVGRPSEHPPHIIINGENYHALQALQYIYEASVDCIYIDPPYNSGGARDWKYNNRYVGLDDAYRHSKWLSFMEKRLLLAKKLLNPEKSVLIVAIDENENHRLGLLLEQIFPGSKIQMVSVLINPAGASIIDQFSRVDEQLFFVHIGAAQPSRTIAQTTPLPSSIKEGEEEESAPVEMKLSWESLQRSGGNSRRQDTKSKFFPIYVDEKRNRIVGCGEHLPLGVPRSKAPPPPKGVVEVWPIKKDGTEACWQLQASTFRKYQKAGRIKLGRRKKSGGWGFSFLTKGHMRAIEAGELVVRGKDEQGALQVFLSTEREQTRVGKTMWINGAYSATEHGSTLLKSFLPRRKFSFPKSLYAVEDALRFYIGENKNAVVLDFFGGSGTTAHAVARLNRQDGGQRRTVLITNNEVSADEAAEMKKAGLYPGHPKWEEKGIFEHITRPRIEAAFTGTNSDGLPIEGEYRFIDPFPMSEGFKEAARFFKLTYLDPDQVSRNRAFSLVANLLWLKAGGVGKVIDREVRPYAAPADAIYAILFDVTKWAQFVDEVRERSDLAHLYIVTESRAQFEQICLELPLEVPVSMLYEDYLSSFGIDLGGAA